MSGNLLQCFGSCTGSCSGQRRNTRRIQISETAYESLSPEEQDRVHRDLYGTDEPIEESEEFIRNKLDELEKELGLLREGIKKHYLRAVDMENQLLLYQQQQSAPGINNDNNDDYKITSPKFRLMFLRAERFNAPKAATRLARYFTEKLELFGEEKLASKIKQEDFTEYHDNHALFSGSFSYTGAKDRAGRSIVVLRRDRLFQEDIMSVKRVFFYMIHTLLEENELSQRLGVVMVAYNINSLPIGSPAHVRALFPLMRMVLHALPFRFSGMLHFYSEYKDHLLLNLAMVVHPREHRARLHLHYLKTHEEFMLEVMRYGIVPYSLPLTEEGDVRQDMLLEYLQGRKQLE